MYSKYRILEQMDARPGDSVLSLDDSQQATEDESYLRTRFNPQRVQFSARRRLSMPTATVRLCSQ